MYRLLDPKEEFVIKTIKNGVEKELIIKGKKWNEVAGDGFLKEPFLSKQLEFSIVDATGILRIHSFSKSAIKKQINTLSPSSMRYL